jgi:hypothetical protein
MKTSRYCSLSLRWSLALLLLAMSAAAKNPVREKGLPGPLGIFVLDGSPVHDVGNLRVHASNWGLIGSMPGGGLPFSGAPSAEWPKGSDVEYLFAGGLWVGGLLDGVPHVSTSVYEFEFRPSQDVRDIVYESASGAAGGNRIPSAAADDDGDGALDEDRLNGYDDDADGMVDEDFAAISDQMLSRQFSDFEPSASQIYPQHVPLNLRVTEESYQFSDPDYDDFVGFTFTITNAGPDIIEDVYLGMFADGDVGPRSHLNYWTDDATGYQPAIPVNHGAHGVQLYDFPYWYDVDGDNLQATGYAGIVVLDHPTDPTGATAPVQVGVSSLAVFSGTQSFEDGGDPTNDFERYQLMSSGVIEGPLVTPRDYRVLVSAGPIASVAPGETVKFSFALVVTPRADFTHVTRAAEAYHGRWFDLDGNPFTGVDGREHQENWYLPESPVPVAITSFDARGTRNGVLLAWDLWSDEPIERLDILRAPKGGDLAALVSSLPADQREYTDRTAEPGLSYEYELVVHELDGGMIVSQRTGATMPQGGVALRAISPNPFTSETSVSFTMPARTNVDLVVYDVTGRRVATVFAGEKDAGDHAVRWNGVGDNGNKVSAGVYFCRIQAGKESRIRKMVVMR